MIQSFTYISEGPETAKHRETYGGYNDFPPNWRKLTEKEFAQSQFFSYSPTLVEHRQMLPPGGLRPGGKPALTARLYFYSDGSGLAMSNDYWKGKVQYFAFAACVHEYRRPTEAEHEAGVVRPARCFHVSICDKCHHVHAVDSSD